MNSIDWYILEYKSTKSIKKSSSKIEYKPQKGKRKSMVKNWYNGGRRIAMSNESYKLLENFRCKNILTHSNS